MKHAYIVSYDLSIPGQNYEELLGRIKSYPLWARLGGSSYIIITEKDATSIRDYLGQLINYNDKLFVGTLVAPAAWKGLPEEVSTWIINNLK